MTTAHDESTGVKPEDSTKPEDEAANTPAPPVEGAPTPEAPATGAEPVATPTPDDAAAAGKKDVPPDPLKLAVMERFSGKPQPDEDEDDEDDEQEVDPKATKPAPPAAAPKPGEAPPAKPPEGQPSPDDPTQGFTEKEKAKWAHTPGPIKEKVRALHKDLVATKKGLEDAKPALEFRTTWDNFVERGKIAEDIRALADEQTAWAIKAQAAIVRTVAAVQAGKQPTAADLETLDFVREGMQTLDSRLGKAPAVSAPASLTDIAAGFKGPIPDDLKAMKDIYGELDDEQIKLLAAHRAMKETAKAKPPAAATPPAPPAAAPPREQPPAPARSAAPAPQWSEYELNRASHQMLSDVAKAFKVEIGQAGEFYDKNLSSISERILIQTFPQTVKTVADARAKFLTLSPADRRKLVTDTIEEFGRTEAAKAGRPPAPGRPPVIRSASGGTPPPPSSDHKNRVIAEFA
jgi:hypothetical protein